MMNLAGDAFFEAICLCHSEGSSKGGVERIQDFLHF